MSVKGWSERGGRSSLRPAQRLGRNAQNRRAFASGDFNAIRASAFTWPARFSFLGLPESSFFEGNPSASRTSLSVASKATLQAIVGGTASLAMVGNRMAAGGVKLCIPEAQIGRQRRRTRKGNVRTQSGHVQTDGTWERRSLLRWSQPLHRPHLRRKTVSNPQTTVSGPALAVGSPPPQRSARVEPAKITDHAILAGFPAGRPGKPPE
jgi:hypothetical protein